jgi:spermidine/putrescine transport system ATP-binding protein
MSSPAAIVLDRVTKVYDEAVVFEVSLDVQAGNFVTLLGPSGSGKTTILQMIGGFLQPTAGRILFGGADMTALPPNKRPCNTIFQDLGLFPHMTVAENVAYGLRVRGVDATTRRRRTSEMLGIVALEGYERRRMHQLSGGQRQRVALARALVLDPAVLLLDEPLTGLDEGLRRQLRDEISRLHRRLGATFLAVTHNQDEALSLSDRIAVLRTGRVEQIGTPRELFERPANAFVARFVGFGIILKPERVEPGATGWRARVAGRYVDCEPPVRRESGAGYVLVLRPERIRIVQANEGSDLGPAMVVATAYKGRDLEIETRLVDGQALKFLMPADQQVPAPQPGSSVEISWQPMRPLLVPEGAMVDRDGMYEPITKDYHRPGA